jgi:uncharacterized protein (DUF427 family)
MTISNPRERVAAYPRPPALVPCNRHIRVEALGRLLADTLRSFRVLETCHPPTFYLPPEAFDPAMLRPAAGRSFCEWKGLARYFDVVAPDGRALERVAWHYPEPTPAFASLAGWIALYAGRWMGAGWMGSGWCPSLVASTAAGLPAMWRAPSRGIQPIRS